MLRFFYKYINVILFLYVVFYIVLIVDLLVLPPTIINEKVKLFKPHSSSYNERSGFSYINNIHSFGTTKWKLEYMIYTQSGMKYNFGTLFPTDLVNENSEFVAKNTRIFSIQKRIITKQFIYGVSHEEYALYAIFPIIFMSIGYYIYRASIKNGLVYNEVFYFYLFSIFVIIFFYKILVA